MGFAVSARATSVGTKAILRQRHELALQRRHEAMCRAMRQAVEQADAMELRAAIEERATRVRSIVETVAKLHKLTVRDLIGHDRFRHFVDARQHAIYEIRRKCPDQTLLKIGRRFGGRDHTTILHSLRAWPQRAAALGIECLPLGGKE